MYNSKVNDTRYNDPRNLMKQLVSKEKLGGLDLINPKVIVSL